MSLGGGIEPAAGGRTTQCPGGSWPVGAESRSKAGQRPNSKGSTGLHAEIIAMPIRGAHALRPSLRAGPGLALAQRERGTHEQAAATEHDRTGRARTRAGQALAAGRDRGDRLLGDRDVGRRAASWGAEPCCPDPPLGVPGRGRCRFRGGGRRLGRRGGRPRCVVGRRRAPWWNRSTSMLVEVVLPAVGGGRRARRSWWSAPPSWWSAPRWWWSAPAVVVVAASVVVVGGRIVVGGRNRGGRCHRGGGRDRGRNDDRGRGDDRGGRAAAVAVVDQGDRGGAGVRSRRRASSSAPSR